MQKGLVILILFLGSGWLMCDRANAIATYHWRISKSTGNESTYVGVDTSDRLCSTLGPLAAATQVWGAPYFSTYDSGADGGLYPCVDNIDVGSTTYVHVFLNGAEGGWHYSAHLQSYSGPPGVPTGVTALVGVAGYSAEIYFAAPSSDGGATITSYTVSATPGGMSATGSASPLIVNGLTAGIQYTFNVIATNSNGNSDPSAGFAFTGRSVDPDRPIHTIVDWVGGFSDNPLGMQASYVALLASCFLVFAIGWVAGK